MPNFKKEVEKCKTEMDYWLYFLRNLEDLTEIPRIFMGKEEFESAFEVASLAKLTHNEHLEYEGSLKVYRDNNNTLDYREKKGLRKGLKKGMKLGVEKGLQDSLAALMKNRVTEEEARRLLNL